MSSVSGVNNKLKRPHGESLARAPVEARWQPAEKETSHGGHRDVRRDYSRPTFSERPQRGAPTSRGRGGAGRGGRALWGAGAAPVPVAVPLQAAPTVPKQKPKPKTKKKTKQPDASLQHNSFDTLSDQRTVYKVNDDFNKRRPDRLTHTFAAVHGYKYRKYVAATKVVKPIELLRVYSSRQAQALEDMLAELALLEAEAQSQEKGKEKLDPRDKRDDDSENKESGGADDAEMQEVMKELVIDLAALNSGKFVQLEPEFDAPTSDFFVAAEHMPRNSGHAAKSVFFQAVETNTARGDFQVADQREQANIFWDESAASASGQQQQQQQVLSFGPERPDLFFKVSRAKPSSSKPQASKPTKGMENEEMRELIELERLAQDGFISREQFKERSADLKERIRVRKAMAKQRKAELKREQLEEEKLWEERDRKLMLERREEDKKLKAQKKQALTRAVLDDFLEGKLSPKELAVQIKSGVVTVEQLLGLWKTELRPLRLVDYVQPSGAVQIGPSKHSKIMADVMYLLQMSDPAKQHGNTIEPSALPQTPEVLHKVEKIAAHNPGLVRKFAHYIHTEREMRAEWQRDVQERLHLACS